MQNYEKMETTPAPGYSSHASGYPSAAASAAVPYVGYDQQQLAYDNKGGDVDNFQLPPDVTVENLPLSDDGNSASLPSAPVLTNMEAIQGYGNVTFNDVCLPPPTYDEATRGSVPSSSTEIHMVPVISEQQARVALLEHCSSQCCYGSGAAKDMDIANMASTSAFHYVLESFGEARSTAWQFVPYKGGPVDTPMNGPAPLPWDIPIYATDRFKGETKRLEVPHTASIKVCHRCIGLGRLRCHHCCGRGRSNCTCCGGYTQIGTERRICSFCSGSGYRVCISCHGHGHVRCPVCKGHCQLKWFIQLTVVWTNHTDDFILERTAMPDENIRKATGETAFQEELPWVYPINNCPEPSINRASADLVSKHRMQFVSERILLQRHHVRIVPVTEVNAQWKGKAFMFYVFGLEHRVFTADYPQMCCCGCVLI
jgi:hypothetical protein